MTSSMAAEYLRWLHPEHAERLGRVRQVLFDFDGTLSTLRQGWEQVMIPLMIDEILGGGPDPDGSVTREVRAYVERSTGILTIRQMEWLEGAVRARALNPIQRTARQYKELYLERLMVSVDRRLGRLLAGEEPAQRYLLAGAAEFIQALSERGITLHLASGTDHAHVVREAEALGLAHFFEGRIYGALDESDAHAKDRIIHDLLEREPARGLVVCGDGPVELREASQRGVFALGVCSDEVKRSGWNPEKAARLTAVPADLLIPDFSGWKELARLFCGD